MSTRFRDVTNRQDLVSDLQTSVAMRRPALNDLSDVDAVVSRDVLVPNAARDTETKTWSTENGSEPSLQTGGSL